MHTSGALTRRHTLRLAVLSLTALPLITGCGKDYQGEVKLDSYDESAGSYEQATQEHPAQNVPKPVKPNNMNEDSTDGLYSTLAYAAAAMQYALRTGDTGYLNDLKIPDRLRVFFNSNSPALGSNTWLDNPTVTVNLRTGSPTKDHDTYTWPGHYKVDFGSWKVENGAVSTDLKDSRLNIDQDVDITAKYQDNSWNILSFGS